MEPAVDPFQPLLRLLDRYRSDVNHLRPPATEANLAEAERNLGRPLPESLAEFYRRWNGAILYRGALRIRSTAELAVADAAHPRVVLLAEGPRDTDHWAFAEEADGNHVFGRWTGDRLEPLHARFHRWLVGRIQVLEEEPRTEEETLDLLLACDPRSPWLLLRKAEALLCQGDPDRALPLLRQATAEDPASIAAWHRLGDVLVASDPVEARFAYVKALRAVRLPWSVAGAWSPDPDLIRSLTGLFDPGDPGWEREIQDLLEERLTEARTDAELAFFEAAATTRVRLYAARRERAEACRAGADLLARAARFSHPGLLPELRLLQATLETDLGHHTEAEKRLRPLLAAGDARTRGRARLALARIVVLRQEPWAEEILEDAIHAPLSPEEQVRARLLLAERHLNLDHRAEAAAALDQADVALARTGDGQHRATLDLLRGDIARLDGHVDMARTLYADAEEAARRVGDLELRLRLAVRAGDLAAAEGRAADAVAAWKEAVRGYEALSLPLRQAWVKVRLGRTGDTAALDEARTLFQEADLAAGVAAVDLAAGDAARSLDWHLARAAEHARHRAEAQRGRTPGGRAEADRPERRLGAHQRAVAACGQRVVKVLRDLVSSTARQLETGSGRPGDPRLATYVAAVDLLAHHPSFDAASVLLDHLVCDYVAGPPGESLKGALARSPNMALVDGLLSLLETSEDSVALSRVAEILGWRRERSAAPRLVRFVESWPHLRVRRAAVAALGRMGHRDALDAILSVLDEPDLTDVAAIALLLLGEREGVDFHAQVLARGESTWPFAGEIVGRYGDPSSLLLLLSTAEREDDAALGALQGLGYLGDMRAVPRLLEKTSQLKGRMAEVTSGALEILTGHHEPTDDPHLRARWERFWETWQSRFTPGLRYRYGRVLDPGLLVEKLGDDDPLVRSAAYDELVITTGQALPFDADGAWRVQVHHREGWERWWDAHRKEFPAGRWIFHGRLTG